MDKKISSCTVAPVHERVKNHPEFDVDSIAHSSSLVRCLLYIASAMVVSGIGVIGLLAFEFYLFDAFGFIGFMAAMGIDALVIYWLVCHA